MCTATVQGKEVFVNARLNQVLSLEDMVQLDVTTQKKIATALFYELASTGHPNHPKIDPVVWQVCALPLTSDELWTMQEPDDIKALLLQLYAVKESHFARMIAETKTLHRLQGMKILEAQQQLNFTAELTLSINQIRGYIEKAGQWNDFEPEVVGKILADMHESVPRPYNHDVNNPNWGQL
ncbi:MAG: hypothetical protein LH609_08985, partial [Rudanella sp.]|nr:hypothetical protein [Rudanella sp.]